MDFLNLMLAPLEQLMHAPGCALIILPVSIVAAVWEMMQQTPSKYIPVVCMGLGMALYPLLTPISTVPPAFPNPIVVLILNGFILGFVAWVVHKFLIKRVIDKFAEKQDAADAAKPEPPTKPEPPPKP